MLSDKVCIVTGGGRGIGRASAIELGAHGATVVVNDLGTDIDGSTRSSEPANSTVATIREAGGTAMAHPGDVSSLEYTEELVSDTLEEYDRIDGVVNFAGILRDRISYKMSAEEWDDVIRVHLRGHYSLLRNVAAHWRREAGDDGLETQRSFLCVSSRSAVGLHAIGKTNYAAAKAGILGLSRTAAQELYRHNIRVNALMPSGFTRQIEMLPESVRTGTPDDLPPENVAPMVVYLLSDAADDITGCTLRAGGDVIGIVRDPEPHRLGFRDGGWTVEGISNAFEGSLAQGVKLNQSDREPWP